MSYYYYILSHGEALADGIAGCMLTKPQYVNRLRDLYEHGKDCVRIKFNKKTDTEYEYFCTKPAENE